MRVGLACILALAAAASAPAQDFAALYQEAERLRLAGTADEETQRAAYRAAEAAFARLPQDAAERAAALPAAAFAALEAGDPGKALQWIEESAALGHDDAVHAELRLRALALTGDARGAVAAAWAARAHGDAVVRAYAAVRATAAGALCEAADSALRAGDTEKGLFTFQALVEASARHPISLANLALALRQLGRVEEAEAHYREALAAWPEDPDLWNDLGLLLKGAGRDDEAVAAFRKSLALETRVPPGGPATSNLVTMMRAGRVRDPAQRLREPILALAGVLAQVPEAAMARRLLLEELLEAAPFPAGRADRRDPPR